MTVQHSVLVIGEAPEAIDFSEPALPPDVTPESILAGLHASKDRLDALGFPTDLCLVDSGATAVNVVRSKLALIDYECIVIGGGIRILPSNLDLFERLINLIHTQAPRAKIAFDITPDQTAAAALRWLRSD